MARVAETKGRAIEHEGWPHACLGSMGSLLRSRRRYTWRCHVMEYFCLGGKLSVKDYKILMRYSQTGIEIVTVDSIFYTQLF